MNSTEIRKQFFEFFKNKDHKIVSSAPIVVKDDPTLMFTNAGMNQFKDLFLGNKKAEVRRLANSQKCLRVSGKHNDLEEVGRDSYHHTMFEMLGNWSIGDYFKKDTIAWAWELLVDIYKLPEDRLYATIFSGDVNDGLGEDSEAIDIWKEFLPADRILAFDKKDNFWEMGDVGPCGPCSEIHIDLRSDEERKNLNGAGLVNKDHPLVIEIWNLVFIQFNRKADGLLEDLPEKHIDTGMGFERLTMALQAKTSNYDTDIFSSLINWIESKSDIEYHGSYDENSKSDIAMRVIVDHLRAVSFAIADGELPSNTGAGYVIRRILRRAVRYYYSFLDQKEPMIYQMVPMLSDYFKDVFPELKAQHGFVSKVIQEEEKSFLRTLEGGLKRLDNLEVKDDIIDGKVAFELYDTYGFPLDLTRLIAKEKGWAIDEIGYNAALKVQKDRSRADAKRETSDWLELKKGISSKFVGYDQNYIHNTSVIKYRAIKQKDGNVYQIVLEKTPFYAEGGGQVGDVGILKFKDETIQVIDTKKENDLIIHYVKKLPKSIEELLDAEINVERRKLIQNNHTATHLLHSALRKVLGTHVQQKGSLVRDKDFRFDFSHFQKLTNDEIRSIEKIVNQKIRENIVKQELRSIPLAEAKSAGAMMLFGEKYGDFVRMITFDENYSRELCGGCHVDATGEIGYFKIISETGIAAGVRRIEAITSMAAEDFLVKELDELNAVRSLFKSSKNIEKQVSDLSDENKALKKEIEKLLAAKASDLQGDLIKNASSINNKSVVSKNLGEMDSKTAKTLAYNVLKELDRGVVLFGIHKDGKAQLMLAIAEELVKEGLHAGNIVRELAKEINGGGGGQPFFATAGGSKVEGLDKALTKIQILL